MNDLVVVGILVGFFLLTAALVWLFERA